MFIIMMCGVGGAAPARCVTGHGVRLSLVGHGRFVNSRGAGSRDREMVGLQVVVLVENCTWICGQKQNVSYEWM